MASDASIMAADPLMDRVRYIQVLVRHVHVLFLPRAVRPPQLAPQVHRQPPPVLDAPPHNGPHLALTAGPAAGVSAGLGLR